MSSRALQITASAVLAAALWIVPSVGTRGQGTLGDRFVHPDRALVATGAEREIGGERALLLHADDVVVKAVGRL